MAAPVICIGTLMVDELYFCNEMTMACTSNPAIRKRNAGGVVGNIARHLALLGIPVKLITVLGNDPDGEWLLQDCRQFGISAQHILRVNENTGKYVTVLNDYNKERQILQQESLNLAQDVININNKIIKYSLISINFQATLA